MVQFLTSSHARYGSKGRWWSQTQILSQTELSQHHRNTTQSQHDEVWDEKCRCEDKENIYLEGATTSFEDVLLISIQIFTKV